MKGGMRKDELVLQVAEISRALAGRGLCSAGIDVAQALDMKAGAIVEIVGNKRTCGIFFPNSEDKGSDVIRIDGIGRLSAGTGLGKTVTIRKATPQHAMHVVVSPTSPGILLEPGRIKEALLNRPVIKDNYVSIKSIAVKKERSDFSSVRDEKRGKSTIMDELRLLVVETDPDGEIVQISKNTTLEIRYQVE